MHQRARYYQVNRPAIDALKGVDAHLEAVDHKLRALLEMRVSQINGCAY